MAAGSDFDSMKLHGCFSVCVFGYGMLTISGWMMTEVVVSVWGDGRVDRVSKLVLKCCRPAVWPQGIYSKETKDVYHCLCVVLHQQQAVACVSVLAVLV